MNKKEFSYRLMMKLQGLPQEDVIRSVDYYNEMIDDRIEDGMTEEQAVAAMGSIDDIAAEILAESSILVRLKKKIKWKRTWKGWEIAVIALGFPLWFPLLLTAALLLFSAAAVVFSGVVSLIAAEVSLVLGGVAGLIGGILMAGNGVGFGGFLVGCALVALGLSIFLYVGCRVAIRSFSWSCKKLWHGFKALFPKREEVAQ